MRCVLNAPAIGTFADSFADGMAYGPPSLTNPLYLDIHRQIVVAGAEDHGGRPI